MDILQIIGLILIIALFSYIAYSHKGDLKDLK